MSEPLELPVTLYGMHIGELVRGERGALFRWVEASELAWPLLSTVLSLNLRVGETSVAQTESFFGGMLPEGTHLGDLARQVKTDRADLVGLLAEIGSDLAGALSVGAPPEQRDPADLSATEVEQLIANARGYLVGGGGSALPGFQRKVALTRRDGRWVRGNGRLPSTHILKPVPDDKRSAAEAELYVLAIARELGLLEFDAWTEQIGGSVALVVERYDRVISLSGEIERVHQEDAGQAIGLPWGGAEKFEINDARSTLRAVAALLDRDRTVFDTRLPDTEQLARYMTLNVAAGDTDAHAKNFSILHAADGSTRLAPYYDSAPLALAYDARTDLAMRVNGVSQLPDVTRDDLVAEAASWGLTPSVAREIVDDTLERIIAATRAVAAHATIADHVPGYVRGQASNLLEGRPARIQTSVPLALLPFVGTPQERDQEGRKTAD